MKPAHTITALQAELPNFWTAAPYPESFNTAPLPHRHFNHGVAHAMKALGGLAALSDALDHGRADPEAQEYRASAGKWLADLVLCATRMAEQVKVDLGAEVASRVATLTARWQVPVVALSAPPAAVTTRVGGIRNTWAWKIGQAIRSQKTITHAEVLHAVGVKPTDATAKHTRRIVQIMRSLGWCGETVVIDGAAVKHYRPSKTRGARIAKPAAKVDAAEADWAARIAQATRGATEISTEHLLRAVEPPPGKNVLGRQAAILRSLGWHPKTVIKGGKSAYRYVRLD